ncbi:acetate kinase [Mucilaginibacter daejeonensis]|uniref:acetate/propionate family kinase n=1 Tax=Mucilaginibacter daejeonensis TaxID=398049 RepID=UPI001D173957|nr:acetate kinase [Mucilaginibacter daejeonensis]UEG52777.1 acetate kinase [Mucilaginibacter daejeonensis]
MNSKNIFVVNSGSSSIKYQLFKMPAHEPVCSGLVERIGLSGPTITHKVYLNGEEQVIKLTPEELPDHEAGLKQVNRLLTEGDLAVIQDPADIQVVGHRIVHGGERFTTTTVIDAKVKEELKTTFQLAPLHNPPSYLGIEVAEKIFTNATQIGVFDTAFHQTLPPKAYRFAIPNSYYSDMNIRVYGFHGTSHKYVTEQAAAYLDKADSKLISIHLGNGCSMAAVSNGASVDTTMGFGPLSGLIMGTRSGDIDPTVIFYLVNQLGYDIEQVSNLLNKRSGMLGLTGYSDMRDITAAIEAGDENARLAYDLYAYRIKKYIGAYAAVLNGLDAIIFTAGVGENDALIRQMICTDMEYLGIQLNAEANRTRAKGIREISIDGSKVKVLIVPTNEELEIAQQCYGMME